MELAKLANLQDRLASMICSLSSMVRTYNVYGVLMEEDMMSVLDMVNHSLEDEKRTLIRMEEEYWRRARDAKN